MAAVTMYTQRLCGCCAEARRLLRRKGVAFEEIGTRRSGGRDGLRARFGPGVETFPQIVIDGRRIGGASDLAALEASGELDRLLSPEAPASAPPAAPR
jgi:glutaredoxin 3